MKTLEIVIGIGICPNKPPSAQQAVAAAPSDAFPLRDLRQTRCLSDTQSTRKTCVVCQRLGKCHPFLMQLIIRSMDRKWSTNTRTKSKPQKVTEVSGNVLTLYILRTVLHGDQHYFLCFLLHLELAYRIPESVL